MKSLFVLFAVLTVSSSGFASDICHMFTGQRVALTSDQQNGQLIVVDGFGSNPVSKVEGRRFESANGKMVLDLDQKVLEVNKVKLHLENCFHTDAY